MRFGRVILAFILAISFASFGIDLDAAKGSKGSGHSTKSSSGPKTVHVKEYTRKDGTTEVSTEYPHGRPGYVIDHVKPLACGGADDPSNMQWQTTAAAKAKDHIERVGC